MRGVPRRGSLVIAVFAGASVMLLFGCGSALQQPPDSHATLVYTTRGTQTLSPQTVNAGDLRWRDIADQVYSTTFQSSFNYSNTGMSYVRVDWNDSDTTLSGTLTAVELKPNFAYQMKLEGKAGITSATDPGEPGTDAWASWQLGHVGRWWDQTTQWNLSDSELASALDSGDVVVGYLLFDYFVTDENGNASKPFALDSSYHVLWKVSQRRPRHNDSRPTSHTVVMTSAWGYDSDDTDGTVQVYAEWEGGRPKPGHVELPAGAYPVLLNITEESFHANLSYPLPLGGFWAQVLKGDVTFEVMGGGGPSAAGSIKGTVTGEGRRVRGADVTLTDDDPATEPVRTTLTKGNGKYAFDNVPAGTSRYTVTATANGKTASQSGVSVQDGVATTVDLQLQ